MNHERILTAGGSGVADATRCGEASSGTGTRLHAGADPGMAGESVFPLFTPGEEGWERCEESIIAQDRNGNPVLDSSVLELLSRRAFSEIAFRLPRSQLVSWARILADPEAGEAEKFVVATLIQNAAVAAEGVLPLCQDTGTAIAYGWIGDSIRIQEGRDSMAATGRAAAEVWEGLGLRSSQKGARSMLEETVTRANTPAWADVRRVPGEIARMAFVAKGGGSANRTSFSMESPALLQGRKLELALKSRIEALGSSGCPPYHLAAVLGGSSPSQTLYVLELAALGLLDAIPDTGSGNGEAYRDREWESVMLRLAAESGTGAQFGGKWLATSARVIRLARHAASLPLAAGVSCAAHRVARLYGSREGSWIECMEKDPGAFLPAWFPMLPGAVEVNLDQRMQDLAAQLSRMKAGSFVLLSGTVVLARDAAHARFAAALERGKSLPEYLLRHPVFYAGPTEARPGMSSGSFGPTTAGRMDSFLDSLMSRGASLVSIAKGGRSEPARRAIADHGGTYLAAIGGAAAIAARDHVRESRIVDYPELGMEAVRLVRIEKLPAMIVIDAEGKDHYARHG